MSRPEDLIGVKRFLGMMQYLGKFLLSLTMQRHSPASWVRTTRCHLALNSQPWCSAGFRRPNIWLPTLRSFATLIKGLDVTIQTNACMQWPWRSPITYRKDNQSPVNQSRAMVQLSITITQIKKELLSPVFSYERFDQYVYGWQMTVKNRSNR